MQFKLPNVSKKGVGKLYGSKVGANHRVMQFFQEKLAKSIPLGDNQLQRCFQIDLFSQKHNIKLMDNTKIGVFRPRQ